MHDEPSPSYGFGPFRLDVSEHRLLRDGVPVPLTPKAFTVLRVLVQNGGHLVDKDTLLKRAWPDSVVEEGALNRCVSVLRKALGDDGQSVRFIETVPKRGYRFVAPVTECRDDEQVEGATRQVARRARYAAAAAIAAVVVAAGGWFAVSGPGSGTGGARVSSAPRHRQVTFTGTDTAPSLSPDGQRVAYVAEGGSDKTLVVQELAGGRPLAVFTAPELEHLRWSPDGSELLTWARGAGSNGVYAIPQLGGRPRRIAARQFISCWSPDGSAVAVGSYDSGRVWLFDRDGREKRVIDLDGVHVSIWDMDWSGASERILVVSSDHQARYTIWTVRSDGGDQTPIVSEDNQILSARWSPRADAIYYSRRENQTVALRRIRVDSNASVGEAATLVSGLEAEGKFSLDARATRVVYARAPYHSNLWRYDVDSRRATELTRGTSLIERPRVSPDGGLVVFNVGYAPQSSLYTVPVTGGEPRRLTSFDSLNVGAAWSPDGERLAFGSTEGGTPRVWAVPARGGTPQPLSSGRLSDNMDLTWTANDRILYQQAGNRNYYDLDPGTRAERLLVEEPSPGYMFAPVASRDGSRIALSWNRKPTRGVWVIDTRNRSHTPVYPSSGLTMPIAWSADGQWIYVVEGRNCKFRGPTSFAGETLTEARILRVAPRGGRVETVARIPSAEIGRVSMTPDGRSFFYPVFSSGSDIWVIDNFDAGGSGR